MRLGDADVEVVFGVRLCEFRQARTVGHRRRDPDDAPILVHRLDHRFAEREVERLAAGLLLELALIGRIDVGADAVEGARVALGRAEALTFLGANVQQPLSHRG